MRINKNAIREISKKIFGREGIGLILLAVLLTSCLNSLVNPIADMLLPSVNLTIRGINQSESRYTTILYEEYENNQDELFCDLKSVNETGNYGWGYVQGEPGISWTMLFDNPECDGITIRVKESPRKYVTFLCGGGGGVVEIDADGKSTIIDTYREEAGVLRIYPFEHSTKFFFLRLSIYILFFAMCMVMVSLAYRLVRRISIPDILLQPIGKMEYLICAVLLAGTGIFQYRITGIPNYLKNGDELDYWEMPILEDNVSVIQRLSEAFSLHGYLCYVPQNVFKYIGKHLSVDAAILWIIFMGVLWSIFICGVFPGLYRNLNGETAKKLHIIPVIILLLTTQRLYLTSVMMDGIGMITFFAYVYFVTDMLKSDQWRTTGFWAGICAAISCNLRVANLIGIIAALVYVVGKNAFDKKDYKRIVEGMAIGVTAFLLVCIPQLVVNYERDHIGLLPYNEEHSDIVDPERPWLGRKLAAWSSDYGMAHGNIAYPLLATDNQMLTMKPLHYGKNDPPLTMEQLFDIYSDSPVESLMLICKKLLIGFDQKTNINSPGDGNVPWRKTSGMLFSLWNYFVLFSGGYTLIKSKYVKRSEKWIAAIVMVFLVLPEAFMKIEWRYVLPGYFMLYYFFTYAFIGPLFENKDNRKEFFERTNYLAALALFMFAYLSMSFIFLAQFN